MGLFLLDFFKKRFGMEIDMANDIIVGVMIVIAAVAGIWCWILERPAKSGKNDENNLNK